MFERCDAKDRDKKWLKLDNINFKAILLKGKKIGNDSALCFDVLKYLNQNKYDVIIIGGYSTPTGMIAIKYLNTKNTVYFKYRWWNY